MACQHHFMNYGNVDVSHISGRTTRSPLCGTPRSHAITKKHGQFNLILQKPLAAVPEHEGRGSLVCCSTAFTAPTGTEFHSSDDAPTNGGLQSDGVDSAGKAVGKHGKILSIETWIEKRIFDFRFFTGLAVIGSLIGSSLCFSKGCLFVFDAVYEFFACLMQGVGSGKVILLLVEAVDVYLIGTVMLIFGLGLYELFVNSPPIEAYATDDSTTPVRINSSSFFGLFRLRGRPKFLEITSLDEMKSKLGHVIVMILLVGMFEKSKKVPVNNALDLLFFSGSVCLAAGCLFLLSKLMNHAK